jgi:hypothetical protein
VRKVHSSGVGSDETDIWTLYLYRRLVGDNLATIFFVWCLSAHERKANNIAGRPDIRIFIVFLKPIYIVVNSSLLSYGLFRSLLKFLGSYV